MARAIPSQSSVPSAPHVAAWAAEHYGLKGKVQAELAADGLNFSYVLRQGRRQQVLRIYRPGHRNAEQTAFELQQLQYLRAAGLPVAQPLLSKGRRWSVPLRVADGPTQAALFAFAPGEIGDHKPASVHAKKVGALLAGLHEAQDLFRLKPPLPPLDQHALIARPLAQLRPYRASFGAQWAWLLASAVRLQAALARLPKRGPAYGLIHGDPHAWNMHYEPRTKAHTLFDFDLSTTGWRLFDLATYLWGSGWPAKDLASGAKALLASYAQFRPLSALERRCLPDMMAARHLWWMGFQASLAWRIGLEVVTPLAHQQKLGFLRRWRSGKLRKELGAASL